jgi:P-type Ca2+ transporter type 2C
MDAPPGRKLGHRGQLLSRLAPWAAGTPSASIAGVQNPPVVPRVEPWLADAGDVARSLDVDPAAGLATATAAERLARHGRNQLASAPPVPAWRRVLAQLRDPLVYLLLAAIAISTLAWAFEGAHGAPVDALVVAVIVAANAILGYLQESRAEQAVAALQRMVATMATVVRDGAPTRVPADEIVPGDVLVLAEGDSVAADARLVQASALRIAEASLTGESEPVLKDAAALAAPAALADRRNMVFKGTSVSQGVGRAVVTATGMATELGTIANLLETTVEEPTPLEREIARLGRTLGIAVVAIALVVIGAVLATSDLESVVDLVEVLLLGVSIAVAAVPEGLPAILSVVLALGVQRMAAQRAIVKKLSSVETLGSASVICSDKTGTLTRNEMTIVRIVTRSGEVEVTGSGYRPDGELRVDGQPLGDGPLRDEVIAVLGGGSLANDASLRQDGDDWTIQGDPSDAAFLVAERKAGASADRQARFHRVGEVPFTSERKRMTSLEADASRGGRIDVVTKGAPDVLLPRCAYERVGADAVALTDERRVAILGDVDRLSAQALRTLGVAYRMLPDAVVPATGSDSDDVLERDLVHAGVVGIIDPPRSEATAAIADAHRAGVRVLMITGDHPRTAGRIASSLGLAPAEARVVTGIELDGLDDEALRRTVRDVSVYARVAPQHKLRIVDALQADGAIVAMTGDGVNDAPALKSADIGVAMGITGTEVTKEAAKMILADDNFATIVAALREGRLIFANIRKFLRYLLSSNFGEVFTVLFGVLAAPVIGLTVGEGDIAAPLLATQILWINLLTDTGPALALGVDPPAEDVMARPPRRARDRIIDGEMLRGVLLTGVVMAVVTLLAIDARLPGGLIAGAGGLAEARTAGFTVLVLAQLFNCLNARSQRVSAFHGLFANRWLWGAIALSLLLQIAVVHVPLLQVALGTAPLSAMDWALCAAMASAVLWIEELHKLVRSLTTRSAA